MGYLKGKSALMIFDKHANLKYKFGNRHFWAEGYYVSTVGLNEATIRKYIQEQESHDIAMDKLSVKEYEDPFKGGDESRAIWLERSEASVFRRWLVTAPYRGERTTRLTGGHDSDDYTSSIVWKGLLRFSRLSQCFLFDELQEKFYPCGCLRRNTSPEHIGEDIVTAIPLRVDAVPTVGIAYFDSIVAEDAYRCPRRVSILLVHSEDACLHIVAEYVPASRSNRRTRIDVGYDDVALRHNLCWRFWHRKR